MSKFHNEPNIYVTDITLKVEDINRSIEFYRTIIGLRILWQKAKEAILTADETTPLVTLIQPEDVIPKLPRRTGLYHFAILLPNRMQLGLFFKNIRDEEYPLIGGSNHGVSEAIYLEDPDGNGIEVYADTPESNWDRDGDKINMVTEVLDYMGLLKATEDKEWKGMPPETIIGHIHLHVADLDESLKFYEALGFNLVQSMRNSAYFVSSGGYHHHIGFNIWNGRGAAPLPENSVGMKYYTIKYPREGLLKEALKNLENQNYEFTEKENSIFVYDPSHNLIQIKQ
ncbi:hypothetical protein DW1_2234 [Proteiniborus sp. DW1]|uniref:VOC family protein n=1 Tax=Proteiniborus sp. DW1 TaxID=1889883 RepID=UPI00092DFFF0|nr:VOC family protein [Proteiniborus sp. DW1]SCG83798.1 hypothetical protein DW1_2234 [Proteiniborus sp. DW1]